MSFTGSGEGNTLLILTDAESRLLRKVVTQMVTERDECQRAQAAYAAGVSRGTARLQEEAKAAARARKGK